MKPTQTQLLTYIAFALLFLQCASIRRQSAESIWLFNGRDLRNWDTYLGPEQPELVGENASKTPFGLNNDPKKVFQVVMEDGAPAIRISGEVGGGISTKAEYENYHLRLEFKWGDKLVWPKSRSKKDSGLLYHAVGPHGVDAGFWMRSQELQIQETDCGDYWGVAGAIFDIPSQKNAKGDFVYDKTGELRTFSPYNDTGRHCVKHPDAEKPGGQWNTIDLYCHGDTAVHVVNGVVNMVLYHSRQVDNGVETPLTKGKIHIQSEGAEVYFRKLELQPIRAIPRGIL